MQLGLLTLLEFVRILLKRAEYLDGKSTQEVQVWKRQLLRLSPFHRVINIYEYSSTLNFFCCWIYLKHFVNANRKSRCKPRELFNQFRRKSPHRNLIEVPVKSWRKHICGQPSHHGNHFQIISKQILRNPFFISCRTKRNFCFSLFLSSDFPAQTFESLGCKVTSSSTNR